MKKKKMTLFDKFFFVWLIITGGLLLVCVLWYLLVERPSNVQVEEVYVLEEKV